MTNIEMKLKSREQLSMEILTLQQQLMLKDKEIEHLKEEKESWRRVATKYININEDVKEYIKGCCSYPNGAISEYGDDLNPIYLMHMLEGSDK